MALLTALIYWLSIFFWEIFKDIWLARLFNVSNATAALTIAVLLDMDIENLTSALAKCHGVPGRMEKISGAPFEVIVDYSEQLGSETYFYCNSKDINQLIVHHTGQYKINKGDELYLRFKRDSLHLFSEDGMSVTNN